MPLYCIYNIGIHCGSVRALRLAKNTLNPRILVRDAFMLMHNVGSEETKKRGERRIVYASLPNHVVLRVENEYK